MTLTFILLAIAVCTIWIKELKISSFSLPLWVVFLIAALASAFINEYARLSAVFGIAIFGLISYLSKYTARYRFVHALHLIAIGLMALLIALGKLPGFHNPDIVTNMRFTSDGMPFTHRLRIDGISVGIILLALFCNPVRTWTEWSSVLRKSAPIRCNWNCSTFIRFSTL